MIAMVLETRLALGRPDPVTILLNQVVEERYRYCPPGMTCTLLPEQDWTLPSGETDFHFGVGKTLTKQLVFDFFHQKHNLQPSQFSNLVHPSSVIASSVQLNTGLYMEPQSVLSPFVTIGFGVTINRGVTIGHHTVIGDFVSINPGSHVAGHCQIGKGVQIGMGTVVFDHIRIGEGSVIGGGSVVTKDIPPGVLAYGNPCTVIRSLHAPV